MVGYCIFVITGNWEDSLIRPTHELTENITALFSLLSASAYTGVRQDRIHHAKDNNECDDVSMACVDDYKSLSFAKKESVDEGPGHEEAGSVEESCN